MTKFAYGTAFFLLLISFSVLTGFCENYPMYIKDGTGNKIIIKAEPKRIISLSPSTTEILYSLGLKNRIIAVSNNCNYPESAKYKEKIGDVFIDFEKILNLRPDLIVSEVSILPGISEKLIKMGLCVLSVRSDDLESFERSFLIIGKACQRAETAKKLIEKLNSKFDEISSKIKKMNKPKVRVFIEIWNNPLQTASKNTLINDLIDKAAGVNIFSDQKTRYPSVSVEEIIVRSPDVMILTTSEPEKIYKNKAFASIKAVRDQRVYKIDPDIISRPSLRILKAVEFMVKCFYPELNLKKIK